MAEQETVQHGGAPAREDHDRGHNTSATQYPSVSITTHNRPRFGSSFFALRFHARLLTVLAFSLALSFLALGFRTIQMLSTNRYASDQTLANHAAQLYAVHAPLPLLYAHILPTLAFARMFEVKEDAARSTAQDITFKNHSCRMTKAQSSQLSPPLSRLAGSLLGVQHSISLNLTFALSSFARQLPKFYEWPLTRLDMAIRLTRNRSHLQETLVTANELFDIDKSWESGIDSYGLKAIEGYNVAFDKSAQKVLPPLADSLSLLLIAQDRYNDVFATLRGLGLSRCVDSLEQSLSEGDPELWHGPDGKRYQTGGWISRLWTRPGGSPPIPKISLANALSESISRYWSIYNLIYTTRAKNILLHESANSFLPPREFPFERNPNLTIFDGPPFRQPIGSRRRSPLGLSKKENDTISALAHGIRNRAIVLDSPYRWTWDHVSTANITLQPFPDHIPCPYGLKFSANSPSSSLCSPSTSASPIAPYPFVHSSTPTYNRLLALQHLRNVFAVVRDFQVPYHKAIHQHGNFIAAVQKARTQWYEEQYIQRTKHSP
ncbi:MAG: hypothetical protein Q9225_006055 [Loekoesia sp. 1 TL-2023]